MLKFLLVALFVHEGFSRRIDVFQSWKNVGYNFPRSVSPETLIKNEVFIPNNIVPLDVDVYNYNKPGQKIFITTPMLKPGTPATLSTLARNGLLSPYPSWNWQSNNDCRKLISVLRIAIDDWGRLWVLDDGKSNAFDDAPTFICPPKVVIFNLKNDQLIGSYQVPTGLYTRNNSLFANIAIDSKHPDNTFAFIADVVNYKLIVFNLQNESFWQWDHSVLSPEPPNDEFDVNGVNFTLSDGVLALAYYPRKDELYFNSFASLTQNSVAGFFLRNGQRLTAYEDFFTTRYNGTRTSQTTVHAISNDGVLFFNPVSENSIRCWDVSTPYTLDNQPILVKDDERLQFITGMKVRQNRFWAVSVRLQEYIVGSTSPNETNYRIVTQCLDKLVQGTKCDRNCKRPVHRGLPFNN